MDVLGREVVIVEAVRTPIGRGHPEKGQFRDVHPATRCSPRPIPRCWHAPASRARRSTTCSRAAYSSTESSRSTSPGTPGCRRGCRTRRRRRRSTVSAVGPAGGQLRRRRDRRRRPRRHDRLGRRAMGRIPMFVGRQFEDAVGIAVHARAARALRPGRPGLQRRDDRRAVESPARAASTRSAPARSSAPSGRRQKGASTARSSRCGERRRRQHRPGHPPRHDRRGASPSSSRPSRRTAVITAGNSSQISDGAAAVLLTAREKADELG